MQQRRNPASRVTTIAATAFLMTFVVTGCLERTDQGQGAAPGKQPQVTPPVELVKTPQPPPAPDVPQVPDPPATTEKPATVETSKPAPAEHAYEIHLQSGFDGKPVTVQVNGKQTYTGNPETDYTIGLADTIRGVAQSPSIELVVEVPSKRVLSTLTIDLTKGKLIGINVGKGKLDYRQSNDFQYE